MEFGVLGIKRGKEIMRKKWWGYYDLAELTKLEDKTQKRHKK
jgi:hypothetical protein